MNKKHFRQAIRVSADTYLLPLIDTEDSVGVIAIFADAMQLYRVLPLLVEVFIYEETAVLHSSGLCKTIQDPNNQIIMMFDLKYYIKHAFLSLFRCMAQNWLI